MLLFFRATLFLCCTLSMLQFFHVALLSCCTFFVLHYLDVTVLSSCTIFMFYFCHIVAFSSWTFFVVHLFILFSRCTFFPVGLFSCCTFFFCISFPVALFSCFHAAIFFMLHFFPVWNFTFDLFLVDLSFFALFSLLFLTLRTFHIVIFHVALISCCTFSLKHISPDVFRGYRKATPGCNGLIKAADLSRTLSVFLYKTLQQYFSMVDKNDILWSWAKDLMGSAQ